MALKQFLSAKPHIAASPRQLELANYFKNQWESYGLDKVELVKYKVLLSRPRTDVLTKVGLKDSSNIFQYQATIKEKVLHPDENDPNIVLPFNAYAKEATVDGELIYVNYARQEDFVKLENDFKLTCKNRIAIARYGKIFRGDKARIAERFNCKGLILYSDPADYAPPGYKKYPDGWFLPETGVQRGTLFLGDGDPQTPGYPSIDSAYRYPIENLTNVLPNIPVQPLSASDAAPLLQAMSGNEVPAEWRGQLANTTYKFGGAFTGSRSGWKAHLEVHNKIEALDAYNVIGTINGRFDPDHYVLVGNHRDSWIFGAVDASSGGSNMLEISRAITTVMQKTGWRPRRTMKFCSWGAEEYGLIGSTEWVEENEKLLVRNAVSYANTDIAAQGNFTLYAAASPIMKQVLYDAAKMTPDPDDPTKSLYDTWLQRKPSADKSQPYVGSLGAGSDYAPFMQRIGVSSVDFSYDFDSGYYPVSSYPAYHTIYDTYDYLKKTIDPDFKYHLAGARVCCNLALAQADDPILRMSVTEYAKTLTLYFNQLASAYEANLNARNIKLDNLRSAINNFTVAANTFSNFIKTIREDQPWLRRRVNNRLMQLDKTFINPAGLPGRPLKKHILFAPSMFNTYGGAKFPGITDSFFMAQTNGNWGEVEQQVAIVVFHVQAASKSLSFTP
ncbi:uncharacterized protein TRIADDRAFT_64334 [Trichoplax adhaerens]|uniref:glutamate carboxypeptidase II n=1 Tax=Trichoplax adhaerens TaxID=10228 RepID=B3SAI0_TRIAD|nr:hypothetical protein TRIADDRAFT_64334 [Trichoplax adhaerens]EDV20314.1 hypothetical protein TRIADDRAFT_64334 [Trichoplax adhaerens]|eukprot:XP_002117264.1 hypothetical protein TRIADDRAFT_64334 [Trichoplax adhaerens]